MLFSLITVPCQPFGIYLGVEDGKRRSYGGIGLFLSLVRGKATS